MTTRRLVLAGAILVAVSVALTVDAHAASDPAPPITWPSEPCNLEHRMDIAIVDGLFFECQCERLQNGYACTWYLVAGVNSAKLTRRPKRHAKPTHGIGTAVISAKPVVA